MTNPPEIIHMLAVVATASLIGLLVILELAPVEHKKALSKRLLPGFIILGSIVIVTAAASS
ncbi:MAG TPA: hypothetical protein VMS08_01990 [Candidatus Saccharimonadia bacterium]|nr:hypothetical protein [Candidatus Saccharimonadia bacterium]